jgi:predicted nicotinamide N-methyase
LALSEVLIATPPAPGTRILELGAGTGLVGLVAARLGADVRMTDGDAGVVETLQRNVEINEMGGKVRCAVRRWAGPRECPEEKVDWVLGADVTYDQEAIPWLVAELRWCFGENPGVRVTIAATVRNVDTWAAFGRCCGEFFFFFFFFPSG